MSHHEPRIEDELLTRRQALCRAGMGFGSLALGTLMAESGMLGTARAEDVAGPAAPPKGFTSSLAPKAPQFAPKAKRVIHIFMNGGPSQVDTFDPKTVAREVRRQADPPRPSDRAQDRRRDGLAVRVQEIRPERHRGQRPLRPRRRMRRRHLRYPLDARRRPQS